MNELIVALGLAFAGGVFGASVGGVAAFGLCGVAAIVGVGIQLAGGSPTFTALVPWGPFLGPQAAFAGAIVAAAFAARRGFLSSGRDVLHPLASLGRPEVLLVGGLGGMVGQGLYMTLGRISGSLPYPGLDAMALTVFLIGVGSRLLLGRSGLMGTPGACETRWQPSAASLWIPAQSRPGQIALLAISVAIPAAALTQAVPQAQGLIFAISAASLLLLLSGKPMPVTLHMALVAETAAAISGGWLIPMVAAIMTGLLAEGVARAFLVYGDTHIDPPALAICLSGLILMLV
ncbi:MAG: hypothetical protein GKS06_09130 [Acidobacteria bacterium]|nr:hypothetical protein [Acidobacteriota bacterium]